MDRQDDEREQILKEAARTLARWGELLDKFATVLERMDKKVAELGMAPDRCLS